MPFASVGEIQEAVRTGRIKRLPVATLEEYLEALAVAGPQYEGVRSAVRDEMLGRQTRSLSRRNTVAGTIGFGCALIAAVVIVLKRCH